MPYLSAREAKGLPHSKAGGGAVLLLVCLLTVSSPAAAQDRAPDGKPLEGAWKLVGIQTADDESDATASRGMLLLLDRHYSLMISDSARTELPENPTAAERAQAFESFMGNTGRYEVRGDTLTTRAFVAKYPYRTEAGHSFDLIYHVDGDTLRLNAGGTSLTFRRLGQRAVP